MSDTSILLVGLPETGKTNYLARLWASLREGKCTVKSTIDTGAVRYVEDALAHLLEGEFAGRTRLDFDDESGTFRVPITLVGRETKADLIVPDVDGELWRRAVEDSDISPRWFDLLSDAPMALLFVRALSPLNRAPLDWVTSERLLEFMQRKDREQLAKGEALAEEDKSAFEHAPTQVYLCQLVRYLEELKRNPQARKKRVAVLVTAWDSLDAQRRAVGPWRYLQDEFPLFYGALKSSTALDVEVFGVTIVGGNLADDKEFKKAFVETGDIHEAGHVMQGTTEIRDITIPLAWLLRS